MCKECHEVFSCGHTRRWWAYCHKATQEQRRSRASCYGVKYGITPKRTRMICCSTKCCQEDLDGKAQVAEDCENQFNMFPSQATSVALIQAKKDLVSATSDHCQRCLAFYDGENITNEYRIEREEPLHDPRPPRIPVLLDIGEFKISNCLAQVSRWKNYTSVIKDRQLFREQIQSEASLLKQAILLGRSSHAPSREMIFEYRLIEIYLLFSDMLWNGKFTHGTIGHFEYLQRLENHMGAVQPAGPNTYLLAVEFALHARRYQMFRAQMLDLRQMINGEYSNGNVSNFTYQNWRRVLDYLHFRLKALISGLESWFNVQIQEVQDLIERFQSNIEAYRKELERHQIPNARQIREKQQSGHSASSRGSSSVRASSAIELTMSEEPEQMQPYRECAGKEEHHSDRRGRRDTGTQTIGATPPTRKTAKGKDVSRA